MKRKQLIKSRIRGWKRTGKNEYRRKRDNRYLQIGISLKDKDKYGVYTQLPAKKMITLKTNLENKIQAMVLARKYMGRKI